MAQARARLIVHWPQIDDIENSCRNCQKCQNAGAAHPIGAAAPPIIPPKKKYKKKYKK